ncbi:chitinase 10-like [Dioscorea cayenensis subsp. rotundata]|uniref:chitinase n=1 Tax=Dioscorea cayennensis subsp. rotundata TaxID=55577 RepID=A0AB40C8B8_DIOCR|nr:chitinase 10-like [Dioscorea cayenensis subsp. rotundata]
MLIFIFLAFSFLLTTPATICAEAARLPYGHAAHISSIISEELYNKMFLHKDDNACPAKGFYPYASFIKATRCFPKFGNTGDLNTTKREVAAFLAQISHETTGGWATAPDGPYAWGLCFKEEVSPSSDYCDSTNKQWPCSPGKSYKGRGPIQLSWNYNYGPAGRALGFDGLGNPDIVANNSDIAFKTALWFWMTPRDPKPSCHDVMVGRYRPTKADLAANRTGGFGLVTNIINGGLECGIPNDARVNDRIGFYERYAGLLGVDVGPNLDCANQKSF